MANSTSGESVIRRVVRLVGAFDDSHRTMSVATLARRSGLPVTTTYRLVDEMLAEGLLEREANAEVRIGTRLWELVSRSSRMVGLREAALPFMEDVQSVVRHSTTLGILESDEKSFTSSGLVSGIRWWTSPRWPDVCPCTAHPPGLSCWRIPQPPIRSSSSPGRLKSSLTPR